MRNVLTGTYNIHTKRIAKGIHILSGQHSNYINVRRNIFMIEKIGEPAMLEQEAEECAVYDSF